MTNGTSQGLYVIVAVVIFGVFVGISYLIFQDSLRPKLMDIFNTSLSQAEKSLYIYKPLIFTAYNTTYKMENDEIILTKASNLALHFAENSPIGLNQSGNDRIKIPYGYRLIVRMEAFSNVDSKFSVDYNASQINGGLPKYETNSSENDAYGTTDANINRSLKRVDIPKNKWTETSFYMDNNHENNVNKFQLLHYSSFGFTKGTMSDGNVYKLRNVQYVLVKL